MPQLYVSEVFTGNANDGSKRNILEAETILYDRMRPSLSIFPNPRLISYHADARESLILHDGFYYIVRKVTNNYPPKRDPRIIASNGHMNSRNASTRRPLESLNCDDYQWMHYTRPPVDDFDAEIKAYYHYLCTRPDSEVKWYN